MHCLRVLRQRSSTGNDTASTPAAPASTCWRVSSPGGSLPHTHGPTMPGPHPKPACERMVKSLTGQRLLALLVLCNQRVQLAGVAHHVHLRRGMALTLATNPRPMWHSMGAAVLTPKHQLG